MGFPSQGIKPITTMSMDRLTAQALRFSFGSTVTVRDLFRVLWTKYHSLPPHVSAVPHELLNALRTFLPYRDRSDYQLRHLVRRALRDERCEVLIGTVVIPPIDTALSESLRKVFPALKEVVVIPELAFHASEALDNYLGLAAAKVFAPRFENGQNIGLGSGKAIFAFAKALVHFSTAQHLRFYALSRAHDPCPTADAEKILGELVVEAQWRQRSSSTTAFEGFPFPHQARSAELDWIFFSIGSPRRDTTAASPLTHRDAEPLAEVLFHWLAADGKPLPTALKNCETVPLTLLRAAVEAGRPVVAIAGGRDKALAVLTVYRTRYYGGPLFNYLVTDESCATELLRLAIGAFRSADLPQRLHWWERKHRFLVSHLRFSPEPRCKSNKEIASRLKVTRKKVRQWLREAIEGTNSEPPLVTFFIRVPSPELALEIELVHRFGLLDARVIAPFADEREQMVQAGFAAAQLFCDFLKGRPHAIVGLGSGYEIRTMVECLDLPNTLKRFPSLKRIAFWALSENPILSLTQGISAQTIVNSIALRCSENSGHVTVSCHRYYPSLDFSKMDIAFVTLRASYSGDPAFLHAAGVRVPSNKQAVAYLLNQFLDAEGNPLLPEGTSRSVPLTVFRTMTAQQKPVVALNARIYDLNEHAVALKTAWAAGLVNCFVVSQPLAERLLQI